MPFGPAVALKEPRVPILDAAAGAELIDGLTAVALSAAQAIRYVGQRAVHLKADGSPVTAADEAADATIREGLTRLAPDLPIVSEEQAEHDRPRDESESYFLVDPLDGTREFIAGSDEYAINIALMSHGAPILGVIVAPALGLLWRGVIGRGAERAEPGAGIKDLRRSPIRTRPRSHGELVVLVSRSHLEARTRAYIERLPQPRMLPCGSALKFCRIAEGSADLYPRLAPTHDWDVAAGHALIMAAGGTMTAPDGGSLIYGTPERRIPAFIASGDPAGAPTLEP